MKRIQRLILAWNKRKFDNHIRKIKDQLIQEMEDQFEDKINFLQYEQYKNGVVMDDRSHELHVLNIPVVGVEKAHGYGYSKVINRKIDSINTSFISHNCTSMDMIKNQAAMNIARFLVDSGFIHSKIENNEIKFFIYKF